jgi:hypothetical protein
LQQAPVLEQATCLGIGEAFFVALMITGDMERAEGAVQAAIQSLDVCDEIEPEGALLTGTIEAVLESRSEVVETAAGRKRASAFLPMELQNVFQLTQDDRLCFVLRALARWSREKCGSVLRWDRREVDAHTGVAISQLADLRMASFRGPF